MFYFLSVIREGIEPITSALKGPPRSLLKYRTKWNIKVSNLTLVLFGHTLSPD